MARHPDSSPQDFWQAVLNEHWPPAAVARSLRDVPSDRQIPVVARVVYKDDGEQQLAGVAVRWTQQHVCVRIGDRRLATGLVWLAPADVWRAT
ncbi:hypothetical protein [Kribbella sp. NPDC051718]|uniref:hypothetical protein n=1 Tax=Kribbella sp. NPDC051718 TaxID=3155168 RepID=UPI003415C401